MSDLETWSERRSTAIHEAGHAVAAYLRGRAFISMSVVPTSELLGVVHLREFGQWFHPDVVADTRTRRVAEDQIVITLAGSETQRAWLRGVADGPEDLDGHVAVGADHDERCAAEMAGYLTDSSEEAGAYVAWLREQVRNWTGRTIEQRPRRFWQLVEALADSVGEHETLSWPKARTVLRGADPALRITRSRR